MQIKDAGCSIDCAFETSKHQSPVVSRLCSFFFCCRDNTDYIDYREHTTQHLKNETENWKYRCLFSANERRCSLNVNAHYHTNDCRTCTVGRSKWGLRGFGVLITADCGGGGLVIWGTMPTIVHQINYPRLGSGKCQVIDLNPEIQPLLRLTETA